MTQIYYSLHIGDCQGVFIINSTFSEKLTVLRKNKGVTLVELGESLGVAKQTVSRWERGEREPSLETISKLCEYFNVPANFLLGVGLFADWDKINDILDNHFETLYEYFESIIIDTEDFKSVPNLLDFLNYYRNDRIKLITILDTIISDITISLEEGDLHIIFKA